MRVILRGILILMAVASTSRASAAENPHISIHWLTGRVYLVQDDFFDIGTNSLIYVGRSHVTVIGASWTPETARQLAEEIKAISPLPVTEVVDTSPDPEWSGGNGYWNSIGAKIFAAKATADLLSRTWPATVADFQKTRPAYPNVPLVPPSDVHEGDFALQNGAIRAIYVGPSHTAGDIFVYFPNERVLDAGSILKEHLGNMAKADVRAYPTTLGKLKALRLDTAMIIAGHWSAVYGADLVDHYLELLRQNEALARQQNDQGARQ